MGIETKERRQKRKEKKNVVEATSLAFPHISRSKRSDAMASSIWHRPTPPHSLPLRNNGTFSRLFFAFPPSSITYLGRRGKRRAAADVFYVVFLREFTNLSPEGVGGGGEEGEDAKFLLFSGNKRSSGSKRSRGNTTGDERGR